MLSGRMLRSVVHRTDDNSAFIESDFLEPVEFRGDIWMTLLLIINAPERLMHPNAAIVGMPFWS
jgi:hypothetical protein